VDRGETRHTTHTFGSWWNGWLRVRKPYLDPNAWRAYEVDGRKRLLPEFAEVRLDKLNAELVRAWIAEQAGKVEAGEVVGQDDQQHTRHARRLPERRDQGSRDRQQSRPGH